MTIFQLTWGYTNNISFGLQNEQMEYFSTIEFASNRKNELYAAAEILNNGNLVASIMNIQLKQ